MKLCIYSLTTFVVFCNGYNFFSDKIDNKNIKNVKQFIEDYMEQEITVIYDKITGYNWLLQQNFSKIILNHNLYRSLNLHKNSSYIFIIKYIESLEISINLLKKSKNWNNHQKYLVIFNGFVTNQTLKQSFLILFHHYIYNSVIYQDNGIFYTWYPYDESNKCGTKVNFKRVDKKKLFLNKIPKKFHSCPITSTWNNMPIMIHDPFNKSCPGALILFINTLAQRMSVNITYLKNNTNFHHSYLYSSSFQTLLQDMEQRKIDMVIYFGYNGFAIKSLQNSARIYQTNFYFFLPPRKKYLQKNYCFNLYPPKLLTVLFAFLVTSTGVWKILSRRPILISIYNIMQLALQAGLNKTPSGIQVKAFIFFLLLSFMSLNVIYNTQLSSVLTKPNYVQKITSIKDLLTKSDIKIMSFNTATKIMRGEKKLTKAFMEKLIPMKMTVEETLKEFLRNDTVAITCTRLYHNYFRNPENLEVIYEPLNTALYFIAMEWGHPLMEPINFWITNLKEKGFMEKYIKDSSACLTKLTVKDNLHLEHVKLSLVHLEGAFVILLVGNVISLVAFLFEIYKKIYRMEFDWID